MPLTGSEDVAVALSKLGYKVSKGDLTDSLSITWNQAMWI
jgi:hypothetical protein